MKIEIKLIRDNGSVIDHIVRNAFETVNWHPNSPDNGPMEYGAVLMSFTYAPNVKLIPMAFAED